MFKDKKKKRRVAGGKEAIEVKISPSHVRPRKDKTEKERASAKYKEGAGDGRNVHTTPTKKK